MTPARRSEKIDPRCRVRQVSRFCPHSAQSPGPRPGHGSSGSPRTPGTRIARAAVLGMRLRGCGCGCGCKVCSTRLPRAEAAMPLIGGFTRSNHTARTTSLARPEDTKNSWLSQSLLRPLSIVFISRGICKPPLANGRTNASLKSAVHTATRIRRRNSRCALPAFAASRASCKRWPAQLRQLSSTRDGRHAGGASRPVDDEDSKGCYAGQQHSSNVPTADARKGARQLMCVECSGSEPHYTQSTCNQQCNQP